jgi:alanine-glyoxylate transaminase/serine-glyoxylate transaminase/serine-pyruvate transaminase
MIPGPIEVSPSILEAFAGPPPSHVSPDLIEAFGEAVGMMRQVWRAAPDSQPFVLAGSGTLAMEMAATNVCAPGDRALVVNSGYFSDRMTTMLRRRGVTVDQVEAEVGDTPSLEDVEAALKSKAFDALFATHVDTSTGVRVDARGLAQLAGEHGALSVFDGVCATAAEQFEMAEWGADVYLTASQKAVGLPAGLALLVASKRALEARKRQKDPPPMSMDFEEWLPIMTAYEERRPSYFATPATNLIQALRVGLSEILASSHGDASGMPARFAIHEASASAMRAAWKSLGLRLLPDEAIAANTLSAIRYPEGVDASLLAAIAERGVIVAGGLHPSCKGEYFRVGHMGYSATRPEDLLRTVDAVAGALADCGHAADAKAAQEAAASLLD